jgi:hypothetical protein
LCEVDMETISAATSQPGRYSETAYIQSSSRYGSSAVHSA